MNPDTIRWIAVVESTLVLLMWSVWSIGFLRLLIARVVAWACIPVWGALDYLFINANRHHYPLNDAIWFFLPFLAVLIAALTYALRKSPGILLSRRRG